MKLFGSSLPRKKESRNEALFYNHAEKMVDESLSFALKSPGDVYT